MSLTLDLARILAALAVFYYHIGLNLRLPLSGEGEYAVTTFLLLAIASAVAFSLPKRQGTLRAGPYLAARLSRLLPLYLFVNLAVYAISFVVPSNLGRPFTVGELALSCLGVSQYFGTRYLSLVFWFIPFIVQVYVLIAFEHRHIEKLRAWWLVPAAFALLYGEIRLVEAVSADPQTVLRNWSPLLRPAEVLLGVQGGLWMTGRLTNREIALRAGLFGVLACVLALGARTDPGLAYIHTLPLHGFLVTVAILAVAGGAAWIIAHWPQMTAVPLWRRLGRATYPFYLIHGLAILFLFHRFGRSPAVWWGYAVFCAVAAVALDAIFSIQKRQRTG